MIEHKRLKRSRSGHILASVFFSKNKLNILKMLHPKNSKFAGLKNNSRGDGANILATTKSLLQANLACCTAFDYMLR